MKNKNTLLGFGFIALLAGFFSITSCTKSPVTVGVDLGTFEFVDSAKLNDNYATYFSLVKGAFVDSIFRKYNIGDAEFARLNEVKLSDCSIEATDGGLVSDWDFGDVYLMRDTAGTGESKLAYGTITDKAKANFAFSSNFSELKSFFDKKDFYIRTKLFRNVSAPLNVRKLKARIQVNVTIAGK